MRYTLGLLNIAASLFVGFGAILLGGFACDESCSQLASHWSRDRDAWQWDAIQGLGVGLFLTALVFLMALIANRPRPAVALLAIQALLVGVFLLGLDATEQHSLSSEFITPLALAPLVFGGAAVAVMRRRTSRISGP
jgi:hypothetical protein